MQAICTQQKLIVILQLRKHRPAYILSHRLFLGVSEGNRHPDTSRMAESHDHGFGCISTLYYMVSGVYTHIPKITHIRTPPFSFAVNTTVRLVKKKRKEECG